MRCLRKIGRRTVRTADAAVGDGHVDFNQSPFCGPLRSMGTAMTWNDNIYTAGQGQTGGKVEGSLPLDQLDNILLPTDDE